MNVKKLIISIVCVLICFLLQTTILAQFKLGNIMPNLIVVIIASIGFLLGRRTGLLIGFFCGLVNDIFFQNIIGFYAFLFMFIGYINGECRKVFLPHDIKLPIAIIVLSDFIYSNIVYVVFYLLKGRFEYIYYLKRIIIPELIFTTVLACIIYPVLNSVFLKIDVKDAQRGDSYIA